MEARRAKGIYYWCPERYTAGYRCQDKQQIYVIEIEEKDDKGGEDNAEPELEEITTKESSELSLHVLTRSSCYSMMKVEGVVGNQKIQLLVDSRSTHNFMNIDITEKLGCRTTGVPRPCGF